MSDDMQMKPMVTKPLGDRRMDEITYRQWLAGMALQGLLANEHWAKAMRPSEKEITACVGGIVALSIAAADALLFAQEGQT
jgi:hypothetical protein